MEIVWNDSIRFSRVSIEITVNPEKSTRTLPTNPISSSQFPSYLSFSIVRTENNELLRASIHIPANVHNRLVFFFLFSSAKRYFYASCHVLLKIIKQTEIRFLLISDVCDFSFSDAGSVPQFMARSTLSLYYITYTSNNDYIKRTHLKSHKERTRTWQDPTLIAKRAITRPCSTKTSLCSSWIWYLLLSSTVQIKRRKSLGSFSPLSMSVLSLSVCDIIVALWRREIYLHFESFVFPLSSTAGAAQQWWWWCWHAGEDSNPFSGEHGQVFRPETQALFSRLRRRRRRHLEKIF